MLFKFWTDKFTRQGVSNIYRGESFFVEAPDVETAYQKVLPFVGSNHKVMKWAEWDPVWGEPDVVIS